MLQESDNYLGKLIGNTGQPDKLTVALRDSFVVPAMKKQGAMPILIFSLTSEESTVSA